MNPALPKIQAMQERKGGVNPALPGIEAVQVRKSGMNPALPKIQAMQERKGGVKVKSKVWLEKNKALVFGSGKTAILKAIEETGSINKAAKMIKMSYRHAWSYVVSAEKRIGKQLLVRTKGGKDGGGAKLTKYAKDLIEKFEKLEQEVTVFTDRRYREIFNEHASYGA